MSKKNAKISVLGLDRAGKTTMLQRLKTGRWIPDTTPTIGMNAETIQIGDVTFSAWDLGGQLQFRKALWEMYTKNSAGLIYVVDVSDPTAPFRVARLSGQRGWSVAKQGINVYTADDGSSFSAIDVTDPAAPQVVGRHKTISRGECVAFHQNIAYLGTTDQWIQIVDITDPRDPNFLTLPGNSSFIQHDIFIMGTELFNAFGDPWPDSNWGGFSILQY